MKKFLIFMLGICLIIPSVFIMSACEQKPKMETWDGTITELSEADLYGEIVIETAEELAGFAKAVNEGNSFQGYTIKLDCDMDLANRPWTPIGYGGSDCYAKEDPCGVVFRGVFDGQNHTIYNLEISTFVGGASNPESATGVGLFGATTHAKIKNLEIKNANVQANHYVGVVVGHARGTIIENIKVSNASVSCVYLDEEESGDKAGVIVGYIGNTTSKDSVVQNCEVKDSDVNAARDAGQLIGCLSADILYTIPQTYSEEFNNKAENVVVSDNNGIQNTENNDRIKNEIVGRINGETRN